MGLCTAFWLDSSDSYVVVVPNVTFDVFVLRDPIYILKNKFDLFDLCQSDSKINWLLGMSMIKIYTKFQLDSFETF